MKRVIPSVIMLFVGFFSLIVGLILAIPLTILALITGKKLQRARTVNSTAFKTRDQGNVLEGEYEEVSK